MDLCSSSLARVAPPQLHLLHCLVQRRSLIPSVLLRDQQRTLLPSAPLLPHLHLWMMQRGQRLLQIGRDTFLLKSLVGQDIHLLIREGARTLVARCGTRGRDSDRQLLLLQAFLGCLMTKGEKIRIKDFKSVLLSVLHRSDRC
jgi:hypothetical protein